MLRIGLAVLVGLALTSVAAHAQSDDELDRQVAERFSQTQAKFGTVRPKKRCQPSEAGEIVVCGDNGGDQRVAPTSETDPASLEARRALNNGVPRAPQFDRGYCPSCKHFGRVPPPVYYVDVSALPQAPEGSDADKIAKGEAPAP